MIEEGNPAFSRSWGSCLFGKKPGFSPFATFCPVHKKNIHEALVWDSVPFNSKRVLNLNLNPNVNAHVHGCIQNLGNISVNLRLLLPILLVSI